MRAFFVTLVVIVVVVFAATQIFVPPLLEARVGEGLTPLANGAPVHVKLSSFPAYRMLTGSVARFDVRVEDFSVDGLPVAEFQMNARNVDVDVGRLLQGEALPVRGAERFAVEIVVTEDGLERYVNDALAFPGRVTTELTSEGLRLSGDVTLLNNVVPVVVTGKFQRTGTTEIVFVPDDVAVQGTALPAFMVTVLREAYTMDIDLNDAPLPLLVDEVLHESGRLILRGRPQALPGVAPASALPAPESDRRI